MITIGLTGSIGMGKSTTARFFAEAGAAVFDADRAVHRLYRGAAVGPVGAAFPEAIVDGVVDRGRLSALLGARPDRLAELEGIVHPLVRAEEAATRALAAGEGRRFVVVDVPLLLETSGEGRVDVVVVATAAAEVQRARVLARPGMTEERFEALLARQMPDDEKRRRAHFVVDTGHGLDAARRAVGDILKALTATAAARIGRV